MYCALDKRRQEIAELCRRFGATRLEAFGSAARGIDFDAAASDADFLVEFAPPHSALPALRQYFGFAEALEKLLERRVDPVSGPIRNPYLSAEIERDRELVFAA